MTDLKEDSAPWAGAESLTANVSGADSSTDGRAREIREALEHARALARDGVPIRRALPAPPGSKNEFLHPTGWQEDTSVAASLAAIDAWRTGDALCAVMGVVCDGIDTDPRHGGAASASALRAAGMWPRVYGRQRTPAGGTHDLVAPLNVGSPVGFQPGIDLRGGLREPLPSGSMGRGFIYIAPTVRVSKADGVPRPYVWEIRPDLNALVAGESDDTGEALAEVIRDRSAWRSSAARVSSSLRSSDLFAGPSNRNGLWTREQAEASLEQALTEIREAHDGSIRKTLFERTCHVARFYPNFYSYEELESRLLSAVRETAYDGDTNPRSWNAEYAIREGVKKSVANNPRAEIDEGGTRKVNGSTGEAPAKLGLVRERASSIKIRRTRYVWEGRCPVGVMTFLAGREGTGKSTVAYDLAARLTRGELPGEFMGQPRSVIVCAGEDSWEHTIAPRLIAVNADLDSVFRVRAQTVDGPMDIVLPRDVSEVTEMVREDNVGMIILDPLMSMLDKKMNSDKYQEVYTALKPVIQMAELTGVAIIGITHLNKTAGTDPLSRMMASRAFSTAPRSVLITHLDDSEDESGDDFAGPNNQPREKFILGHEKHNLGPKARTLAYHIEAKEVGWDDGPIISSRIVWDGESKNTVAAAMNGENRKRSPAVGNAETWLRAKLTQLGGFAEAQMIKKEAEKDGLSWTSVERASRRDGFVKVPPSPGVPARWQLAGVDLDRDSE